MEHDMRTEALSLRTGGRPSLSLGRILTKTYLFGVFVAILAFGASSSPYFFTVRNLTNIISTASVTSVLAVGQFFVIVTGGIDLSVGSVTALATVLVAIMLQDKDPGWVTVVVTLGVAGVIGLINGALVVYGRISAFIVTLAMLSIAQGVSYIVQSGQLIQITRSGFIDSFAGYLGPVPIDILIFVAIMVVAAFVMVYTAFGRELYAIGGNVDAARVSGLPVGRDLLLAYVLSSCLAGLAGVILACQLQEGSSLVGRGYELDAIAAVVVGGASLFGGTGDPVRSVIGGLIIGTILNIMNLLGIAAQPQLVIKGLVILIAVFFSSGDGAKRLASWVRAGGPWARRLRDVRSAGGDG